MRLLLRSNAAGRIIVAAFVVVGQDSNVLQRRLQIGALYKVHVHLAFGSVLAVEQDAVACRQKSTHLRVLGVDKENKENRDHKQRNESRSVLALFECQQANERE